jgi:hypothetical protein
MAYIDYYFEEETIKKAFEEGLDQIRKNCTREQNISLSANVILHEVHEFSNRKFESNVVVVTYANKLYYLDMYKSEFGLDHKKYSIYNMAARQGHDSLLYQGGGLDEANKLFDQYSHYYTKLELMEMYTGKILRTFNRQSKIFSIRVDKKVSAAKIIKKIVNMNSKILQYLVGSSIPICIDDIDKKNLDNLTQALTTYFQKYD